MPIVRLDGILVKAANCLIINVSERVSLPQKEIVSETVRFRG